MPPKKESFVWKHMHKAISPPPGSPIVYLCNHCGKSFNYHNSTSNMRRHLIEHHRSLLQPEDLDSDLQQPVVGPANEPRALLNTLPTIMKTLAPYKDTSKEFRSRSDALLRFLVANKIPPNVLSHPSTLEFFQLMDYRFSVPNRVTFTTSLLPGLVARVVADLREKLSHSRALSITLDMWTCHRHSFLVVTGHFISQVCVLDSACLGLLHFPESHTAGHIRERFDAILRQVLPNEADWGKISAITTDTAANVKKMAMDSPWTWVPCMNHILNLTVHDAIDEVVFAQVIQRARDLCSSFRNTQSLCAALEARQRYVNSPIRTLLLDVRTRWNSLYLMIERLLAEKQNIRMALTEVNQEVRNLSEDDWKILDELQLLLRPFYDCTNFFSSEQHPSLSVVSPLLKVLLDRIRAAQVVGTSQTAQTMRDLLSQAFITRLREYLLPSSIHRHAAALDPRMKEHPVNRFDDFFGEHMANVWDEIRVKLVARRAQRLAVEAAPVAAVEAAAVAAAEVPPPPVVLPPLPPGPPPPPVPPLEVPAAPPPHPPGLQPGQDDGEPALPPSKRQRYETLFGLPANADAAPAQPVVPLAIDIDAQIALYKAQPVAAADSDPLVFWKQHAQDLPDIFDYALSLLVIQGSETPSERAFSWAGAFYDESRAAMHTQVLADYMMVYANDPLVKRARSQRSGDDA